MSLFNNQWIWREVESLVTAEQKAFDAIAILGPSGIGKTYQMQQLIDALELDAYWIHSSNCTNSKELRDMIQKGFKTNLLSNLAQVKTKKVVIIDELEVFVQMDRMMMSVLSDVLQEFRSSKGNLILIGDSLLDKKVSSLKGTVKVLECSMPSHSDVFVWCKDRAPKSMKKTLIMEIAEASNGNPGYALEMIKAKSVTSSMGTKQVVTDLESTRRKLTDDPWLYPLRFHENLIKQLNKKKGTKQQKSANYQRLLTALCDWDYMMANTEDPVYAMEHIAMCICEYYTKLEYKKGQDKDASDDFTKVFSNLSLQKKQERSLYAQGLEYPWMHAEVLVDFKAYKH